MTEIVLHGRKLASGRAEGEAVVSRGPLGFLGSVDTATGVVVEKNHELAGVNITGKILVYPTGKGSTGGSFALYEMVRCKTAPKGIINLRGDAVTVVGAIISDIPMIDQVDRDPTEVIATGDHVILDSDQGTVRIKKKT